MKILVVEDEVKLARFIKKGLEQSGYIADVSNNGSDGLELALVNSYDLILLDMMLPGQNGMEFLKNLKSFRNETPVIVVSALTELQHVVQALDEGAWDYIKKPFEFEELLARVRILQRKTAGTSGMKIEIGQLSFDLHRRDAIVGGEKVTLTNRQFALLELLWLNRNRVVTKTTIAEKVWEKDFDMDSNIIEVTVHQLRKKIDPEGKLIETIVGRGYVFNADE